MEEDQTSDEYQRWKETHKCDINFEGSAGAVEPLGMLEMFQRSLQCNIRYTQLIADGDTKTQTCFLSSSHMDKKKKKNVIVLGMYRRGWALLYRT